MRVVKLKKALGKKETLNDVSFELKNGEITGLIGRNGSGKTTLFRTMSGIYNKDEGDVFINKQSLRTFPELKEQLFYLDERYHFLGNQTPKRIEGYYQEFYSSFDSEKYYSLLLKYKLDETLKINQLSKGNQALFKMILAFSSQARFYLFDEPFDGLDIIIKKKVMGLLLNEVSTKHCAIMISSHNLIELEDVIDHALFLKDGQIKKDFYLEDIKSVTKKYQMVFQKKEIPALIRNNCHIIHVHGRVLIGIFDKMTDDLYEEILAINPVLFEEVPVTLEDIFSSHFIDEADYQLFN